MRRLSRVLIYLLSFGLARGGLFVAPIVLANLLSPADYGTLELAQALASLGATVLAVGTSGAVPLVLVRKVDSASWAAILLHQVLVTAGLLVFSLACALIGAPKVAWMAGLSAGALLLQGLWSVVLKSRGRGEASLMLDAGFWGGLALMALAATAWRVPAGQRGEWVAAGLLVYLAGLAAWTAWQLGRAGPRSAKAMYGTTLRTGVSLMALTLLALLATTSGRLGIGLLSTPEITADYAVLFRATALPIVAHQVILVAGFRQVFELPVQALERRLLVIVALVGGSVMAFWVLSGLLGVLLGSAFVSTFARHRTEGLLILTQCILWSAVALNDLVNARSQSSARVVKLSALYFAVVLPLAGWYLSARAVTLSMFVPVHSAVMGGYFLAQALTMWRCGIRLRRLWLLAFSAFAVLSALAYVF